MFDKNKIKISNMKLVYYGEKITQYLAKMILAVIIILIIAVFVSPNDCPKNAVESICFPASLAYLVFIIYGVPIAFVLFLINRIFNTIKLSIISKNR